MRTIIYSITISLLVISTSFAGNSRVDRRVIDSKALASNLVELDPKRAISIYLPPGYQDNSQHYPVLYFISNYEQQMDAEGVQSTLDAAIENKHFLPAIVVGGNFTVPGSINFFGNNPTSGRWLDFIHKELVPYIDKHYRTVKKPEARAISGHFLGGYAAIRLAMTHPETFGAVYALHPVATDLGDRSFLHIPNWREIHEAKTYEDLKSPYSEPFVAMAQAYLPNPDRPPFYADYIVEIQDNKEVTNVRALRKLRENFHLAELLPKYAENLQTLRGIGFDWGRNDANFGHVTGARKFSVKLQDFGVPHIAEEHGGNGWDYEWNVQGKIYWDMLPFVKNNLEKLSIQ